MSDSVVKFFVKVSKGLGHSLWAVIWDAIWLEQIVRHKFKGPCSMCVHQQLELGDCGADPQKNNSSKCVD